MVSAAGGTNQNRQLAVQRVTLPGLAMLHLQEAPSSAGCLFEIGAKSLGWQAALLPACQCNDRALRPAAASLSPSAHSLAATLVHGAMPLHCCAFCSGNSKHPDPLGSPHSVRLSTSRQGFEYPSQLNPELSLAARQAPHPDLPCQLLSVWASCTVQMQPRPG